MKRKSLILSMIALFCILAFSVSMAAPTVYVKNKPLADKVYVNGQLYVNLEEFLTKSNYSWKISGNTIEILGKPGGGPKLATKPTNFSYEGQVFTTNSFVSTNKLYVQAEPFAKKIGMTSAFTKDTNSLDFYSLTSNIPEKTPDTAPARETGTPKHESMDSSKGTDTAKGDEVKPPAEPPKSDDQTGEEDSEAKGGKVVTIKDEKKSLIKPKVNFFSDWRTGEVRGDVTYTNSAKKKVEQISIKFMLCDGYGKALQTWKHDVGTLEPGAKSKTYTFYYINPSQFTINDSSFKYEFTYKEPPKEKKKDEKKEGEK